MEELNEIKKELDRISEKLVEVLKEEKVDLTFRDYLLNRLRVELDFYSKNWQ